MAGGGLIWLWQGDAPTTGDVGYAVGEFVASGQSPRIEARGATTKFETTAGTGRMSSAQMVESKTTGAAGRLSSTKKQPIINTRK